MVRNLVEHSPCCLSYIYPNASQQRKVISILTDAGYRTRSQLRKHSQMFIYLNAGENSIPKSIKHNSGHNIVIPHHRSHASTHERNCVHRVLVLVPFVHYFRHNSLCRWKRSIENFKEFTAFCAFACWLACFQLSDKNYVKLPHLLDSLHRAKRGTLRCNLSVSVHGSIGIMPIVFWACAIEDPSSSLSFVITLPSLLISCLLPARPSLPPLITQAL